MTFLVSLDLCEELYSWLSTIQNSRKLANEMIEIENKLEIMKFVTLLRSKSDLFFQALNQNMSILTNSRQKA